MQSNYKVEFLRSNKEGLLPSPDLQAEWLDAISGSDNLRVAQQTPQWVNYRRRFGSKASPAFSGNVSLCVMRDSSSRVVGVSPLLEESYCMNFAVGARTLLRLRVNGALLMGNAPIMPSSVEAYGAFFDSMERQTNYNSIYMLGIPKDTPFWDFVSEMQGRADSPWLFYRPESASRYHCIEMGPSFDEYLTKFTSKRQHRREVDRLRKLGATEFELLRVTEPSQVQGFLSDAAPIAATSWQKVLVGCPLDAAAAREELLTAMAAKGNLRCYLLKSGGAPCAYIVGFQMNGIFNGYETAYDDRWAKSSPGKAIIFLAAQDLFACNSPRVFYFGPGDQGYKRWFANTGGEEETVLILRKNLSNHLKIRAHRVFRSITNKVGPLGGASAKPELSKQ